MASTEAVAVIVIAVVIFVFAAIAMVILQYRRRATRHAPTDSSMPLVLMVTEIDGFLSLKETLPPELLEKLLKVYKQITVDLIAYHECYEMEYHEGTFYIAALDVDRAIAFAEDLQWTMFGEKSWRGETQLDDFYRGMDLSRLRADPSYEEYTHWWNGPRVACSIHQGYATITKSPSGGYRYTGEASRCVGEISAYTQGGQVVLSQTIVDALDSSLSRERVQAMSFDNPSFKPFLPGVGPTGLFRWVDPRLAGRKFSVAQSGTSRSFHIITPPATLGILQPPHHRTGTSGSTSLTQEVESDLSIHSIRDQSLQSVSA